MRLIQVQLQNTFFLHFEFYVDTLFLSYALFLQGTPFMQIAYFPEQESVKTLIVVLEW